MHDDGEQVERLFRIEAMKGELAELSGGQMEMDMAADIPPAVEEEFLQQMLAFEHAQEVPHRELLVRDGVELPAPDELDDDQLALKLIEVIHKMAERRTYLENTNHLSDRELYTYLCDEVFNELTPDIDPALEMNCHIALTTSGSDEDIQLWLRYYADEATRTEWAQDFPEMAIPPHEDPPFDRDRHLPQPPPPENPFDNPEVAADFWTACRTRLARALEDGEFHYAPLTEEPEAWAPPYACIWKICPPEAPETLAFWGISGDIPTAVINAEGMPHVRDFLDYISTRWLEDAARLESDDPPVELQPIPVSERPRMAHALAHVAELLRRWAADDAEWAEEE